METPSHPYSVNPPFLPTEEKESWMINRIEKVSLIIYKSFRHTKSWPQNCQIQIQQSLIQAELHNCCIRESWIKSTLHLSSFATEPPQCRSIQATVNNKNTSPWSCPPKTSTILQTLAQHSHWNSTTKQNPISITKTLPQPQLKLKKEKKNASVRYSLISQNNVWGWNCWQVLPQRRKKKQDFSQWVSFWQPKR